MPIKRRIYLPFICIFSGLLLFSMRPQQEKKPKKEALKFVWLKKKDWKALEKITTKGKKTTAVVDYKTRLLIMTQVQYADKDMKLTKEQLKKLKAVFKKYD